MNKTKRELTFKHNLQQGRHGWLRLSPAYSVKVVDTILNQIGDTDHALDPFAGTGTTGLVCAERGLHCTLFDINPFLVWLAETKIASYTQHDLLEVLDGAKRVIASVSNRPNSDLAWTPPLSNIERWWSSDRLVVLSHIFEALSKHFPSRSAAKDLLLIAFCRLVIEWSNAAFDHQSMSFKQATNQLFVIDERELILAHFSTLVRQITASAATMLRGKANVIRADARAIPHSTDSYTCVITSPPYPNRMSYIRELRPYMYWLGYLNEPREAGELDWQAIGGTWGVATSRLNTWQPNGVSIDDHDLTQAVEQIASQNQLLANYVHKYFIDMLTHFESLYSAVAPAASVFYIVGNSKFYHTVLHVEKIYAHLLSRAGFENITIETLRKRNSKKELFEYLVSAQKR